MRQSQFSGFLPKPLQSGDKIELDGTVASNAECFSINLVCDSRLLDEPQNVVFNFEMMFDEQKSVSKSKYEGFWQEEHIEYDLTLSPGEDFNILFLIQDDTIYTYCNSSGHPGFTSKLPIKTAKYVEIWNGLYKIDSMKVSFAN